MAAVVEVTQDDLRWRKSFHKVTGYVDMDMSLAKTIARHREAVRAEQAAELAKFKALAETLAGALDKSRDGWANALELGIIPERHRNTAEILAQEAAEALRQYKEARDAS